MPDLGSTACQISQDCKSWTRNVLVFVATVTCEGETTTTLVIIAVDPRLGPLSWFHTEGKQTNKEKNNITSCHVQLIRNFFFFFRARRGSSLAFFQYQQRIMTQSPGDKVPR